MKPLVSKVDAFVSFIQCFARQSPFGCGAGRLNVTGLCVALCASCSQQIANAEQPPLVKEPATKLLAAKPASLGEGLEEDKLGDDGAELRRGYGAVDMRFNACITRKNDHTLAAAACPPGFVIYGPYVQVPPNAEIEVAFDVRTNEPLELYADIVSRMGTQNLAGLNRRRIEADVTEKLGYRVHVFNAEANVESRIGVNAAAGTEFEITDLTMTVR